MLIAPSPCHHCSVAGTCPPAVVYTSGDYLPRLEDEHCPFPACPCDADGAARCESFHEGTLVMPDGNTTLILVVRNPVEVVLSALFYHRPVMDSHGGKTAVCHVRGPSHASAVYAFAGMPLQ